MKSVHKEVELIESLKTDKNDFIKFKNSIMRDVTNMRIDMNKRFRDYWNDNVDKI